MSLDYALRYGEPPGEEVRRIAHELVSDALSSLHSGDDDVIEAVHETRKRCKELRGLARLVRPALGDEYTRANAAFRDAARQLSPIRDAHAVLATFDAAVAAHPGAVPEPGVDGVREALARASKEASTAVTGDDERIARARDLIVGGRGRIDGWRIPDGFEPMAGGVGRTYTRGRKAGKRAAGGATDENLHEWRKRVKYLWYHVQLLGPSAPSVLDPLAGRLHDLSDALGDDHDLAVLTEIIRGDVDGHGGDDQVAAARVVIDARRADLQRRALRLGPRLFAEPPDAFVDRLRRYWEVWREVGDELQAGEIEDLT